jgi:hypothetical protein
MRLDTSGNLGIGTSSPAAKLQAVDSSANYTSPQLIIGEASISTGKQLHVGYNTTANTGYIQAVHNGTGYKDLLLNPNGGNLGLGVTPRAWAGGYKSFDITGPGAIASTASGDTFTQVANGAWFNGTNWIYQYTGVGAARYQMTGPSGGGNHSWHVAASGTAGNAISFTQAMTLDASGQLLLGGTSLDNPQSWGRIAQVINSGTNGAAISVKDANNEFNIATYSSSLIIADGVTERARITSGGAMGVNRTNPESYGQFAVRWDPTATSVNNAVGISVDVANNTTNAIFAQWVNENGNGIGSITRVAQTNAVVYNTTSDHRLKSNIEDAAPVLEKLMSVQVRQYDWTEGDLHQDYGFVAQELEPVLSGIVTKGKTEEDIWQLDYSRLTPHLLKAIQEQQAIITQLTARITALEGT